MTSSGNSTSAAPIDAAEELKVRLRADLRAAMLAKASVEVAVLRALMAALDNAQAVPLRPDQLRYLAHRFGDGSAEAPRLTLTDIEVAALLDRERHDRL